MKIEIDGSEIIITEPPEVVNIKTHEGDEILISVSNDGFNIGLPYKGKDAASDEFTWYKANDKGIIAT